MQPHQQSVLDNAMSFPMDHVIDRYAKEEDIPVEVAKEHEMELKRFLFLCGQNSGKTYGMKGPIDKLWHTFLLFSRSYAAFCEETCGHFIHHEPDSDGADSSELISCYSRFLNAYESTFREKPPVHIWPQIGKNGEVGCSSCNGCHGCKDGVSLLDPDAAGCTGCGGCSAPE